RPRSVSTNGTAGSSRSIASWTAESAATPTAIAAAACRGSGVGRTSTATTTTTRTTSPTNTGGTPAYANPLPNAAYDATTTKRRTSTGDGRIAEPPSGPGVRTVSPGAPSPPSCLAPTCAIGRCSSRIAATLPRHVAHALQSTPIANELSAHEGVMPLRVAVVHSFYSSRQPSGENAQVHAEVAALRRAGVDVRLVAARTDDLEGEPFYRLRSATRVATGRGRTPRAALDAFRPDLVHVHHLSPHFGRRWVEDGDVPVVATLHNFRTVCASGDLVRDGHLCTDCPDGRPWSAVRHRCYRGSVAATLPLALALWRGPRADPLLARADRVLCLSPRQRRMLVDAGLPAERLLDWTNFLPDALVPPPTPATFDGAGPTALFVGRLAAEKGGLELVRSWPASTALHVVGDGPQADEVQAASAGKDVRVTPQLARDDVLALMRRSGALVIPSAWPECLPLVFLEALACGLPVV